MRADPFEDPLVRDALELDHASSRYRGVLDHAHVDGSALNELCVTPGHEGPDRVRVTAHVNGGRVVDVAFDVDGCLLSRAASALLARAVLGANVEDVARWDEKDVERFVGLALTPFSVACANVLLVAFRLALTERAPWPDAAATPA